MNLTKCSHALIKFYFAKIFDKTMDSVMYCEIISSTLLPFCVDKFGDDYCFLHHDNATSHTAAIVKATLNRLKIKNVKVFWLLFKNKLIINFELLILTSLKYFRRLPLQNHPI